MTGRQGGAHLASTTESENAQYIRQWKHMPGDELPAPGSCSLETQQRGRTQPHSEYHDDAWRPPSSSAGPPTPSSLPQDTSSPPPIFRDVHSMLLLLLSPLPVDRAPMRLDMSPQPLPLLMSFRYPRPPPKPRDVAARSPRHRRRCAGISLWHALQPLTPRPPWHRRRQRRPPRPPPRHRDGPPRAPSAVRPGQHRRPAARRAPRPHRCLRRRRGRGADRGAEAQGGPRRHATRPPPPPARRTPCRRATTASRRPSGQGGSPAVLPPHHRGSSPAAPPSQAAPRGRGVRRRHARSGGRSRGAVAGGWRRLRPLDTAAGAGCKARRWGGRRGRARRQVRDARGGGGSPQLGRVGRHGWSCPTLPRGGGRVGVIKAFGCRAVGRWWECDRGGEC